MIGFNFEIQHSRKSKLKVDYCAILGITKWKYRKNYKEQLANNRSPLHKLFDRPLQPQ